jgi:hypothetical protein
MSRIAAAALTIVVTLGGMYAGFKIAGATTRGFVLGKLSYDVQPTLHGRAELVIPRTGLRLEAKALEAPYVLRVKPRSISAESVAAATVDIRGAVQQAKQDLIHGAIWSFVRAFLYALGGGLVGAAIAAGLVLIFGKLGRALLAGIVGVALTVALVGASALWVWQAHYVHALEHPTVIVGPHRKNLNLTPLVRKIRHAHNFNEVLRDIVPLLTKVVRG